MLAVSLRSPTHCPADAGFVLAGAGAPPSCSIRCFSGVGSADCLHCYVVPLQCWKCSQPGNPRAAEVAKECAVVVGSPGHTEWALWDAPPRLCGGSGAPLRLS